MTPDQTGYQKDIMPPSNSYSVQPERIVISNQPTRRDLYIAIADCLATIGGAVSALAKVIRGLA